MGGKSQIPTTNISSALRSRMPTLAKSARVGQPRSPRVGQPPTRPLPRFGLTIDLGGGKYILEILGLKGIQPFLLEVNPRAAVPPAQNPTPPLSDAPTSVTKIEALGIKLEIPLPKWAVPSLAMVLIVAAVGVSVYWSVSKISKIV